MRFFRFVLISLAVVIALAGLFVGLAFHPTVQTWFAGRLLTARPGWKVSVESVSARFSKVEFTNLRVEREGAVLTLPLVTAGLPMKTALWEHQLLIGNLVAQGWTLDLSHASNAEMGTNAMHAAPAVFDVDSLAPARQAAQTLFSLLHGWRLPNDVSLDAVELEGDVLVVASSTDRQLNRVHVTIKGGGLAAGHPGDFAVEAKCDLVNSSLELNAVAARGKLRVGMETPRTIDRLEFTCSVTSSRESFPPDLSVTIGVTPGEQARGETYALDVARGPRHLAIIGASVADGKPGFAGTWKLDLRNSDLAPIFPQHPLPELVAAGGGRFESGGEPSSLHVTGALKTAADRLEVLAPTLARVGSVTLETGFNATQSGHTLRVDRLALSLNGARPVAVAQSAQAFSLDERTWQVRLANAAGDWFQGSLRGLPLAWLPSLPGDVMLADGDATGDFTVKATDGGGFALASTAPLVASGISMQQAGRTLGEGLELSLAVLADYAPDRGWHVRGAPLTVSNAGRRLAVFDLNLAPVSLDDRRVTIAGKWTADLDALTEVRGSVAANWMKGRSASGEFSAKLATALEWSGKLKVIGRNPANSLALSGSGYFDGGGGASFRVPVTIALGTNASEFTADGQWAAGKNGRRLNLELSGVKVALEHLGLFAEALPLAKAASKERDQIPFWDDVTGEVKFDFYQLLVGSQELNEVSGAFEIARDSIQLRSGKAALAPPAAAAAEKTDPYRRASSESPRSVIAAEGGVAFDAAAEFPYSLKGNASIDGIDETRLFGTTAAGHDAAIDGRCAVTDMLTSNGGNLADLLERRREEIHLTSKRGAVRLLKTSVAESIPEGRSAVSDDLTRVGGAVGNAVAMIFGVRGEKVLGSGKNIISPAAEAVLNFTYGIKELSYDDLAITAVRGADRTIQLTDIAIDAPNERLTGTGKIDPVEGKSLAVRPLSLDLRLGVRGPVAASLATTGLLAAGKDAQGYTPFRESVHFGGTLEQIDATQWHALLVKVVAAPPKKEK